MGYKYYYHNNLYEKGEGQVKKGECRFVGHMKALFDLTTERLKKLEEVNNRLEYTMSHLDRLVTIFDGFVTACDRMEQVIRENKRPDIVTARKLSDDVGVSPHTIVRWYKEGRISGFRMSDKGTVYFDRDQALEDIKHIPPEEAQPEKRVES